MTVNVTVVGLGRVGGSLARRLMAQDQVFLSGYDRDTGLAREAQRQGALHKSHLNMLQAVEQADLVLLTGLLAEQREALRLIAPVLRAGSVTVTLAPLLAPPLAWAAEFLAGRAERHFIAGHPAFNPNELHTSETGYAAAAPALFEHGLWSLAPAPDCAPEAARLVSDLARLTGAFAYFVDPAEHDGLAAASEGLPALFALALMRAAAASPGWPETRKVAERSFATATAALAEADPDLPGADKENLLRYLDAALAELQTLRQQLAGGEAGAMEMALAQAAAVRAAWLSDRQKGDWEHLGAEQAPGMPTAGNMLGRFLVGGLLAKRAEDATGGESR